MSALASRVDAAVARLAAPEREALERRERAGEDYAAIAKRLGVGREAVADLLVSARLAVGARVEATPPPAHVTPECAPARRVLAAQQDGEAIAASDAERAREHVASCEPCREARRALREATLACRVWQTAPADRPPPPPLARRAAPPADRIRRRRAVAVTIALLVLVVVVALVAGGGGDRTPPPAAPVPQPGSAHAAGRDVVPGPGDTFCPPGETSCK